MFTRAHNISQIGELSIIYCYPRAFPMHDEDFKLAPVLEDLYSFDAD